MEPKEPRRKKPIRVSAVDYIASLVRSPLYLTDFETFRKRDAQVRGAADLAMIGDIPGAPERDFLARWPLLRKPIPPVEAKKAPAVFVDHIVPAAVLAKDTPESWDDPQIAANLPWPAARFHPVFINLFRTEPEILAEVKKLLRDTRIDGVRMSGQREKTREKGIPDLWKVWDICAGQAGGDIRKAAEILFPDSFRYRRDRKELEAEAREEYEAMLKKERPRNKAEAWYDNRLGKAKAASWRVEERRRRMGYVRTAVESAREMIAGHAPVEPARALPPMIPVFGSSRKK